MSDKNIFEKDVEIPEIVQQKADLAFSQIYARKDGEVMEKSNKKVLKFVRRTIAAVAAVAIIFAGIKFIGGRNAMTGADNIFTIKVCAAELKDGNILPISENANDRQFFYGSDWEGNIEYGISIPIKIEGEHIESVTYKMNDACLEVVSIDCPSIVKDGSANKDAHENSTYMDGYDMAGRYLGETVVEYYDSFTMDYDVQKNSKFVINIVDSMTNRMDLYYLLTNDANDDFTCSALTYMLKDAIMTAEVTFADGTTASTKLGLFAKTYTASDVDTDGTEFTYTNMGIFCYDIDNIDDETKKFIDDQISGCEIYCFEDGAPLTETTSEISAEEETDISEEESFDISDEDAFDSFDKFNIPGFDAFYGLGNDFATGMILDKSGREVKIITGPEDEVGFFDISLKYGDIIAENITMADCIIDNVIVEKDENTAFAILILGEGGDTACTKVYQLDESGISELESYDYENYDFPNLQYR